MSKITLNSVADLTQTTTAQNTINANFASIQTAFDNTLSRGGTSPNQMQAVLDMNSNQIINLPAPSTPNSPARVVDVVTNPTIVLPGTGTSGHVVPYLDGTNTFSGSSNTFLGDVYFQSGRPWVDVRAWGAKGDASTDDTAAFLSAIAALEPTSGGIIFVPPGVYLLASGITNGSTQNVRIVGAGRTASYLYTRNDVPVVTLTNAGQNSMENITVFGKGVTVFTPDTGTFGATADAVVANNSGGFLKDMTIWGGRWPLNIGGIDMVISNVECAYGYGQSNVNTTGSNWHYHCKWDHDPIPSIGASNLPPYPAWVASTSYTVGRVVTTGGYAIQCVVAGTSGTVAPTLKNYNINMVDGSVTWQLLSAAVFSALLIQGTAGENHFLQVDCSGPYTNSFVFNSSNSFSVCVFRDGVCNSPVVIQQGSWCELQGCEFGNSVSILPGYAGCATITDNWGGTSSPITVGANVNNFIISNNFLRTAGITVATGTSNHYVIANNVGVSVVTDGGSGVNKSISGNVQ